MGWSELLRRNIPPYQALFMTTVSNIALVDTLQHTKLLTESQLDKVRRYMRGRLTDAQTLARAMLKQGWLTDYQMDQLLLGKGHQLVIGPYQVLDQLGKGGQSTVYKAKHAKSGWVVALKVIRAELLASSGAAQQFMQEMEAMAALNHPNIVNFFDADKIDDTYYCALEYVEGMDLGKYVHINEPLSPAEASDYIRQTALGLQHAYERNLIHRDIKPVNLILTTGSDDELNHQNGSTPKKRLVKILDWGLASLRPPKSSGEENNLPQQCKAVIGTADYFSPEQALNPDNVDIRGDIYSLGCTFYYLLTGHPPFPDGSLMQKILCHQKREPVPVDEIRPDLPMGLATIIKRMMAKKPEDRYRTPGAVAMALKPFSQADRFLLPRLNRETRHRLGLESDSKNNTPLPGTIRPKISRTSSNFRSKSDTYHTGSDTYHG